ncbi:MAG: rhodanese-like domain-containing protein [Desulfotomaculaceae bacterium]
MGSYQKAIFIAVTFLIVAAAIAGCAKNDKIPVVEKEIDLSGYKNADIFITPQELHDRLGQEDILIFDANKPTDYPKGHIPGAVSLGWQSFCDTSGKIGDANWGVTLPKEELKEVLESYGIDNNQTIVFYSDVLNGPGADGRYVWQLRKADLDNAKLLYGGLELWKALGYDTDTEPVQPVPATGLVLKDYDEGYNATKDYVAQNLGQTKIIDARTLKEYEGDTSRGEARGGHIPDAIHLEWKELLNKDATPKTAEEIIAIMKDKGITPEDDFVLY